MNLHRLVTYQLAEPGVQINVMGYRPEDSENHYDHTIFKASYWERTGPDGDPEELNWFWALTEKGALEGLFMILNDVGDGE